MTPYELIKDDAEQAAIKAYESGKYKDAESAYKAAFKVEPSQTGSDMERMRWSSFFEMFTVKEGERLRSLYPVEEFMKELDDLCKKYKVCLSSGCGCCGAGGSFGEGKDMYEFEVDIRN